MGINGTLEGFFHYTRVLLSSGKGRSAVQSAMDNVANIDNVDTSEDENELGLEAKTTYPVPGKVEQKGKVVGLTINLESEGGAVPSGEGKRLDEPDTVETELERLNAQLEALRAEFKRFDVGITAEATADEVLEYLGRGLNQDPMVDCPDINEWSGNTHRGQCCTIE